MSSLQKFHRRTNGGAPAIVKLIGSEAPVSGSGFYLGMAGDGTSYMYVAPKSTEVIRTWGTYGTVRGTVSSTNGLANTNTLYAFGSAAHPAAYYCKTLATGGYNTWYLPARDEVTTLYSNKSATPFATNNQFTGGNYFWSSTEGNGNGAWGRVMSRLGEYGGFGKLNDNNVRAIRKTTI